MKSAKFVFTLFVILLLAMGSAAAFHRPAQAQSANAGTTLQDNSITADPHWTRTFAWTIDKSVYPTAFEMYNGESDVATYTITLTKDGGTDAAWITGTICTTNGGERATEGLQIVATLRNGASQNAPVINTAAVDVSGNPVLDPGETGCWNYSVEIPLAYATGGAVLRVDGDITIMNHSGKNCVGAGNPCGPSPAVTTTLPAGPTLINDWVTVNDSNGGSWVFYSGGAVSYTEVFTCGADAGTHTNTAIIAQTGQSDTATVTVTCVPPPVTGCTYTPGYWKTHSSFGPAPYDPTWGGLQYSNFYLSPYTWYSVMWVSPGGNPYYQLSFQYVAAYLNQVKGAAGTPEVNGALAWAHTFFSTYAPNANFSKALKNQIIYYAGILGNYNAGYIGPGHCGE